MGESQSKERRQNENGSKNQIKVIKKDDLVPLWTGLGIMVGALASVIAAPIIIAGIGFGAGGIAAGSMAAAWMSASGPVAAGSLIAILQSIGAAGMGAASIGVAAAAGGVVGGTVAAGVSLAVLNESDSSSYKSKAEDLKRLFKDVPNDECLIADYSGALVLNCGKSVVRGRLYLTLNYFCFYSDTNEKKIIKVLFLRDVVDVKKESSSSDMLQFQFITEYGKYVFVNLEAREDSYELLISIWKKSLNSELTSPVEQIKMITDIYGMDLGFRDTEEVMAYFAPFLKET